MPELPALKPAHPSTSPLESLQQGVRHRQLSAEGQRAWTALRRAFVLTLLSLVTGALLPGVFRNLVAGGFAVAAALTVVRLLWPSVGGRRFWRWSLYVTGAMMLVPWIPLVITGRVLASILVFALLVLRPYRFLPELGSRRRALTWIASLFLIGLFIGLRGPTESGNAVTGVLHHLYGTSRFTLVTFWVMCTVWIFLGVRLHFLRMRPKLAVAGLLLAAVPLGLMLTLGLFGAWTLLGAGRAEQASSTLESWLELAGSGALNQGPFVDGFTARDGDAPAWRDELADAIAHAPFDPMPPALWLNHANELWAVGVGQSDGRPAFDSARRLGRDALQRLARETGCVVGIYGEGDVNFTIDSDSGAGGTAGALGADVVADSGDSTALLIAWPGRISREEFLAGGGGAWNQKLLWFGGAPFEAWKLEGEGLARDELMLGLRTRPGDVLGFFTERENDLNAVIVIGLASVAVIFFLLQMFALYFGLRIVGGVTGAVGHLHKATERLARGDLEARVEIPNEDEFGDLAESFNEMTRAIRVAQDQIVQKQLLEAQLDTARGIQQRLLPSEMPRIDGYQIAGSSVPSLQVGGDYFDFVEMPDGRLGIAVADVTGKGVPAALLMANVQAGLHGQALHPGSAAEIIGRMNDLLYESTDAHMFATFALIVLDPASGTVESVSAGHEPTLLVHPDGSWEKLEAGGLMLGMMPGFEYSEAQARMEPGDLLVLYTDGVTEAMGPAPKPVPALAADVDRSRDGDPDGGEDGEDDETVLPFFEEHRLVDVCVARRHESAESVRRALLDAVRNFAQDVPQSDDITIVVVKREDAA